MSILCNINLKKFYCTSFWWESINKKRKLGVFQSYDMMNIDSYLHFREEGKIQGVQTWKRDDSKKFLSLKYQNEATQTNLCFPGAAGKKFDTWLSTLLQMTFTKCSLCKKLLILGEIIRFFFKTNHILSKSVIFMTALSFFHWFWIFS